MSEAIVENTIKYLLVVVEGKSDRTTFENALRKLLKEYTTNKDLEIDVVKGDSLVFDKDKHIIAFNKEEETIGKQISNKLTELNLKASDIVGIAMITDLDACFAPDEFFVEDDSHIKTFYDFNERTCKRRDIEDLKEKRRAKFRVINRLHSRPFIGVDGRQIKYRLFYLNIDLEWTFYQRLNCTKLEKTTLSENFDTTYGDNLKAFEDFINALPTSGTDFLSSWKTVIDKTIQPFDVCSNIRYLLDWIKTLE